MLFVCYDDSGCQVEVAAATTRAAAQKYVDSAEWGEHDKTFWVNVYVRARHRKHETVHKVRVDPPEPKCTRRSHQWGESRVWGHGGGVRINEACRHCGWCRITDTWAQDPVDGEQGLESVEYQPLIEAEE